MKVSVGRGSNLHKKARIYIEVYIDVTCIREHMYMYIVVIFYMYSLELQEFRKNIKFTWFCDDYFKQKNINKYYKNCA